MRIFFHNFLNFSLELSIVVPLAITFHRIFYSVEHSCNFSIWTTNFNSESAGASPTESSSLISIAFCWRILLDIATSCVRCWVNNNVKLYPLCHIYCFLYNYLKLGSGEIKTLFHLSILFLFLRHSETVLIRTPYFLAIAFESLTLNKKSYGISKYCNEGRALKRWQFKIRFKLFFTNRILINRF